MAKKIKIELIKGVGGYSISLNDYRICGEKPWGGGKILGSWLVNVDVIEKQFSPVGDKRRKG